METLSQLSQNKLKKGDLRGQKRQDGQVEGWNLTSEGIKRVDFLAGSRKLLFWERAYPEYGFTFYKIRTCLLFLQLVDFFILQFPGNRVPIQTWIKTPKPSKIKFRFFLF